MAWSVAYGRTPPGVPAWPPSGFLLRGFQPPVHSGFGTFRVSSFVLSEKGVRIRSHELWRKIPKGLEGCAGGGDSPRLGALGHVPNELGEGRLTKTLEDVLPEDTGCWCGCEWRTRMCHLVAGNQAEDSKEMKPWAQGILKELPSSSAC